MTLRWRTRCATSLDGRTVGEDGPSPRDRRLTDVARAMTFRAHHHQAERRTVCIDDPDDLHRPAVSAGHRLARRAAPQQPGDGGEAARRRAQGRAPADAGSGAGAPRGDPGDRLEALFRLMLATGLRRGEALGLHWSDVHLDAGHLRVRRPSPGRPRGCSSMSPRPCPAGIPLGGGTSVGDRVAAPARGDSRFVAARRNWGCISRGA